MKLWCPTFYFTAVFCKQAKLPSRLSQRGSYGRNIEGAAPSGPWFLGVLTALQHPYGLNYWGCCSTPSPPYNYLTVVWCLGGVWGGACGVRVREWCVWGVWCVGGMWCGWSGVWGGMWCVCQGVWWALVGCAGRWGEKVSLAALLSGYLGKSGHLPRWSTFLI